MVKQGREFIVHLDESLERAVVVLFDFAGSLYTSAQQLCMCLCGRYLDSETFTVLRYCFEAKRCFFFGGGGGGGGLGGEQNTTIGVCKGGLPFR